MTDEEKTYSLWLNRTHSIASFHPMDGYELIRFDTHEAYQAQLWILIQSGFRFQ